MNKFSSYLKKKKPLIKKLVEELSKSFSFVSVLGTDVKGTNYFCDKNNVTIRPSSLNEAGFVLRLYRDGMYFEHSFSDISNTSFSTVLESAIKLSNTNLSSTNVFAKQITEEELTKAFMRKDDGKAYSPDEIIRRLKGAVLKGMKEDKIINVRTRLEINEISKMYVSTSKDLEQYYTWNYGMVYPISRDGDNIKSAYSGFGYHLAEKTLEEIDNTVSDVCKLAIDLLDSSLPTPGVYTIITDPSITGLFAHEAFGHGLEMDMFVKERAKSVAYIGKEVASPLLSMHDGASSCLSSASYFFDDEGVLAHDTIIIKDGILQGGICDSVSAAILNYNPTGNGRRESYKRKVYTRMTNTFFSKGKNTLEEMIASVKYGFYVSQTDNGMEDPKNWGIQCSAAYGREIVDGKFTGKIIAPVVMSGYVIDFLKSIEMIANTESIIGSGFCGKGYKEWVPVSDGGACLKAEVKIG